MNSFIVFLRGVNIGGSATVKMDELKLVLLAAGFAEVKTWINSGNIALRWKDDRKSAELLLGELLEREFGMGIGFIIKTAGELEDMIAGDPFDPEGEGDNAKRLVAMLSEGAEGREDELAKPGEGIIESFRIRGDLVYIYYRDGVGKSRFSNSYIEKRLGLLSTSRNWNTLLKMRALTAG
jgi:uncharacterized protein (DUF1697 family)